MKWKGADNGEEDCTCLCLSEGCFPGSSLSWHRASHNLLWGNEALFYTVGPKDTTAYCVGHAKLCVSTKALQQRLREAWQAQSQSGRSRGSHSDISRDIHQDGENKEEEVFLLLKVLTNWYLVVFMSLQPTTLELNPKKVTFRKKQCLKIETTQPNRSLHPQTHKEVDGTMHIWFVPRL